MRKRTKPEGKMKKWIMAVASVGVALATMSSLSAAEPQGLKFELTPYIWLAGMEGDVTVNDQKVEFDKSFSDLLDNVEVAGSLLGVVQYDRFLVWGQVDYFSMSNDKLDLEDKPQGGTLDTSMLLGEVAVGYQVDGWVEGQTFDLLVGVRTLHIENTLKIKDGATYEKNRDRTDPILVVRPSIPILPSKIDGLRFNATLAIGGGDSKLVYELHPAIQYQITENIAARVGYRTVGYKVEGEHNDKNEMNFSLSGLIAGVGVTF
jgi:opacity protein-like surface antigen